MRIRAGYEMLSMWQILGKCKISKPFQQLLADANIAI